MAGVAARRDAWGRRSPRGDRSAGRGGPPRCGVNDATGRLSTAVRPAHARCGKGTAEIGAIEGRVGRSAMAGASDRLGCPDAGPGYISPDQRRIRLTVRAALETLSDRPVIVKLKQPRVRAGRLESAVLAVLDVDTLAAESTSQSHRSTLGRSPGVRATQPPGCARAITPESDCWDRPVSFDLTAGRVPSA